MIEHVSAGRRIGGILSKFLASPESRWYYCWIPAVVTLLTFLIFLPALDGGFLDWDDITNLVENRKYQGLGWEQLKWMFTSSGLGPYAPLTTLTYSLDYVVYGMNPIGFHLTSVFLHTINASLFYFLCARLMTLAAPPSGREQTAGIYISSGFAALFFAVHPLRTESVAWLSDRHDLLSGLFYILTVLSYVSSRGRGNKRTPIMRGQLLPLFLFLPALLSKGMAISLPLALIVLDFYPLRRLPTSTGQWFSRENRHVWLEKVPFFVLAAVFGLIGYICQSRAGALSSWEKAGFSDRAGQVLFAIFLYIRNTLAPVNLSPLYKLPAGSGLWNFQALLAGTVIASISAAVIILRRRWPAGLTAWVYYLAALSPVSGIVKINSQAAADRYTYLPCLSFAILAGAGLRACLERMGGRLRSICAGVTWLVITGLAFLTWRQETIWNNSETLWRYALSINPRLDVAHNNLGNFLDRQGRRNEAVPHYLEAIKISPAYPHAHTNLGTILFSRGKTSEAIEHYNKALESKPDFVPAHYNLGGALSALGRIEEAAVHYREAIRKMPDYAPAYNNLGGILLVQGKTEEAIKAYERSITSDPHFAQPYYNLGVVLSRRGDAYGGALNYRKALKLKPDYAQAHFNLGVILAGRGNARGAAWHYREAIRLKPDYAQAHNNLGNVLAAQGKALEAARHCLEAVKIRPDFWQAHYNLARILAKQGKKKEAARHYHKALKMKS